MLLSRPSSASRSADLAEKRASARLSHHTSRTSSPLLSHRQQYQHNNITSTSECIYCGHQASLDGTGIISGRYPRHSAVSSSSCLGCYAISGCLNTGVFPGLPRLTSPHRWSNVERYIPSELITCISERAWLSTIRPLSEFITRRVHCPRSCRS